MCFGSLFVELPLVYVVNRFQSVSVCGAGVWSFKTHPVLKTESEGRAVMAEISRHGRRSKNHRYSKRDTATKIPNHFTDIIPHFDADLGNKIQKRQSR